MSKNPCTECERIDALAPQLQNILEKVQAISAMQPVLTKEMEETIQAMHECVQNLVKIFQDHGERIERLEKASHRHMVSISLGQMGGGLTA